MAGEIPPLILGVTLDTAGVSVGIDRTKAQLGGLGVQAEETGKKFSGMGNSMIKGLAATAAIVGAAKFLKDAIKSAEDMQIANTKLATSLNDARQNTDANRIAIEKSTKSMENLGFKATETKNAFAQLVSATGSVTQSTKLMGLAADLARVKHEDLGTAAQLLARATTGSMRAFKEFGIVLDAHLPKSQAIAKAMDELNQKIGGQAAAYADTFAGKMQVMGAKMQDVKETIGGALLPVLSKLVGGFTNVIETIKPFLPALTLIILAIGSIVAAVKIWKVVTEAFTAVQKALDIVLSANPIMLVVAGIALLVAAFVIAWNHSQTFRNIAVDVMKAVVQAIGWVIGAVGELVTSFIKFESGPLKAVLGALSHLPFVGGAAKAALKEIGNVTKDVGNFFDEGKKKVDSFANGLDSLKKMATKTAKSDLIGGGVSTGGDTGILAANGVNLINHHANTAAKHAAAALAKHEHAVKKSHDNIIKLYDQQAVILLDRQDKMNAAQDTLNTKRLDAQTKFDDAKKTILQNYNDAVDNENTKHNDAVLLIEQNRATAIANIQQTATDNALKYEQQAADQRQSIIEQSINVMTSTWQSATKINLGSLFKSGGSAQNVAKEMQKQLDDILNLQKNAGKLAAAGYSQSFINQVLSQGTQVGSKMAESILNSTPETQDKIKNLYTQISSTSATGLDGLAKQMNDGTNFATEGLSDSYAKVSVTLAKNLADNQTKMNTSLAAEQVKYTTAMTAANKTYSTAMDALSDARDKALDNAQKALTTSLENSQDAFNKSIDAISQATMKKLDALQVKIAATASLLSSLGAVTPADPNSLAGIYTPKPGSSNPIVGDTYQGGRKDFSNFSGSKTTFTQNINVNGSTAPSEIAQHALNAIKFGARGN